MPELVPEGVNASGCGGHSPMHGGQSGWRKRGVGHGVCVRAREGHRWASSVGHTDTPSQVADALIGNAMRMLASG